MEAAVGAASGLVSSVVKQLSDELVQPYVASSQLGLNADKIKVDLMFTQGLLQAAEQKGVTMAADNTGLQGLLHMLSTKADQAEDALDELHYFIIQDQLDGTNYAVPDLSDGLRGRARHGRHALRHTVGNCLKCFSCSRTPDGDHDANNPHNDTVPKPSDDKLSFDRVAMSNRIKSVIQEMHSLCEPVSRLLHINHGSTATATVTPRRPPVGSTIAQDTLYGRRDIFEKTLHDITVGTFHRETLSVLPVVGPGGIGKTTFTQHLYNDARIQEYFAIRVWVCVSIDFDVLNLSQQILSCIQGSNTTNQTTNLDQLQISIAERLKSKRFLIVFDDIWECSSEGWKTLLAPFRKGEAKGNMVLVTTRFPAKAEMVKTTDPIALEGLEPNEFFTFFEAFIFDGHKPEEYQDDLTAIARNIAKKLKGSPLAAKTVGRLLKKEFSREHWMGVLENNEWQKQKTDDDIMPSLRISYDYLPFHLKKCFPYFALFPEDYRFKKLEITYFWIAIGIIDKDENYMEELMDNGFLVKQTGEDLDQYYVLHDLLHELSRSVSSQQCLNIYSSLNFRADSIPQSIRHLSITMEDRDEGNFKEEMINLRRKIDIANLRSLMIFRGYEKTIDDILKDTFKQVEGLRVLFIVVKSLDSLPRNFSKLIHIRYLKISTPRYDSSEITLPSTLSKFYHLKLLDLGDWHGSDILPKDISRLINIRHFVAGNELHSNVPEVGKMRYLQELKKFCVKKESVGFELSELGKLTELGGELSIYNLEKVATKEEAMEAKLVHKKNLKRLRLVWGRNEHTVEPDAVLDGLEPHPNLGALDIINHVGAAGPCWLRVDILLSLHLEGVSWGNYPPFGQLLHLMSLTLIDIPGLGEIRPSFGGKSFMHLKRIVLDRLPDLIEWVGAPNAHSFLKLEHICCRACPNLCALPFLECSVGSYTPHLLELQISDCPKLPIPSMPHVSTLTSFSMKCASYGELSSTNPKHLYVRRYKGVLAFHNLEKTESMYMEGVSHISLTELSKLKSLRNLSVSECDITWHGLRDLTWLRSLRVKKCGNFFRGALMSMKPFPVSLRELEIYEEASMQSMALLSNLTENLTSLKLMNCKNLRVDGFNPLITAVNLQILVVWNSGNGARSVAAVLMSGIVVAIRSNELTAGCFRQLEMLIVDSISTVLVAPICTLLAATLKELYFYSDDRVERLTEEEEKALQLLTSLQTLRIDNCPGLPSLPQGLHTLPCLSELTINSCPEIRSLPKGKEGYPASLRYLSVRSCSAELQEQAQKLKGTISDLHVYAP